MMELEGTRCFHYCILQTQKYGQCFEGKSSVIRNFKLVYKFTYLQELSKSAFRKVHDYNKGI